MTYDCGTIMIVIYCRLLVQTNKLLCIKFLGIATCHCAILMVADVMKSHNTHYKCYWNTFKQGNTCTAKVKILMVLHNHDCGKVDISITIMKTIFDCSHNHRNYPALTFSYVYNYALAEIFLMSKFTIPTPKVSHE